MADYYATREQLRAVANGNAFLKTDAADEVNGFATSSAWGDAHDVHPLDDAHPILHSDRAFAEMASEHDSRTSQSWIHWSAEIHLTEQPTKVNVETVPLVEEDWIVGETGDGYFGVEAPRDDVVVEGSDGDTVYVYFDEEDNVGDLGGWEAGEYGKDRGVFFVDSSYEIETRIVAGEPWTPAADFDEGEQYLVAECGGHQLALPFSAGFEIETDVGGDERIFFNEEDDLVGGGHWDSHRDDSYDSGMYLGTSSGRTPEILSGDEVADWLADDEVRDEGGEEWIRVEDGCFGCEIPASASHRIIENEHGKDTIYFREEDDVGELDHWNARPKPNCPEDLDRGVHFREDEIERFEK